MGELTAFPDPDIDRLAGLVFELAAQLHVERQHRMALETALVGNGLVLRSHLDELAGDEQFLGNVRTALQESQEQLLAILLEIDDARHPLRDRAAGPGTKGTVEKED